MENKMLAVNARLKYPPMLAGIVALVWENIQPKLAAQMHRKSTDIINLNRYDNWRRLGELCTNRAGCTIKSRLADNIPIFRRVAIGSVIKVMVADQNLAVLDKSPRTLNMNCPISDHLHAATPVRNLVKLAKLKPQ